MPRDWITCPAGRDCSFKCPKCGGKYFGTRVRENADGSFNTDTVECHNMTDGGVEESYLMYDHRRRMALPARRVKYCKWYGHRREAFADYKERS